MAPRLEKNLKREFGLDPKRAMRELREALKSKQLRPDEFSIRRLAEQVIGYEYVDACRPNGGDEHLTEAATGAVQLATFSSITKELLSAAVMEGYEQEDFVLSKMVKTVPTQFDGERIPGITSIGDQAEIVNEGQPYPTVGFNEDYVETPQTTKRGMKCAVTKEAIFFDRTGLIMDAANKVGLFLGTNKEKRVIDAVIGVTNNYKWKGVSYSTYQASTPWINLKATNNLVDWTNVDASEQLFNNLTDPHTGEPIILSANTILVMPPKAATAKRILNATEVRVGDGASNTVQTVSASPITGYSMVTSRLAYARVVASGASAADGAKWWFHGDFAKAFRYMENWPITVVQAPANSYDDFERDIVMQVRASERGVIAVVEPRAVIKNYDA